MSPLSLPLPERSERDEERACDDLVRMLGGKEAVVQRSPPHKFMGTRGIPDRRYRLFQVAFDFEVKKAGGELSDYQVDYLRAERACGCLAACGTLQDLLRCVEWLREAKRNDRTYAELVDLFGGIVEEWVQKREAERQAVKSRKEERRIRAEFHQREKAERAARRALRKEKLL
jgi:hypothetical protein